MKFIESTDTAGKIGEAIGKLIAIFIVCALVWITLATVLHF
jgi:hypothetical protein